MELHYSLLCANALLHGETKRQLTKSQEIETQFHDQQTAIRLLYNQVSVQPADGQLVSRNLVCHTCEIQVVNFDVE